MDKYPSLLIYDFQYEPSNRLLWDRGLNVELGKVLIQIEENKDVYYDGNLVGIISDSIKRKLKQKENEKFELTRLLIQISNLKEAIKEVKTIKSDVLIMLLQGKFLLEAILNKIQVKTRNSSCDYEKHRKSSLTEGK
jgi:hypothetical protein